MVVIYENSPSIEENHPVEEFLPNIQTSSDKDSIFSPFMDNFLQ